MLESKTVRSERMPAKRLWIGYAIAPLVAPIVASLVVFGFAAIYLISNPEEFGDNPMALILVPVFVLIFGGMVSYAAGGLIGLPIAFWLRKNDRLTGYAIQISALLFTCLTCVSLGIATFFLSPPNDVNRTMTGRIAESIGATFFSFLGLYPLILLSTWVFWLIAFKRWKR